uniref:CASTOR ACT domain-containing protein n=1 Tax=Vannella robusta TaxID=1487602 RepID=A0A7S4IH33_9EUKA|mmetsp:Transcript_25737/g.32826  ORF Transcript_25737/g.32826 Transcript_25737/m.32826 type:complete len:331 (+) Transcript_25737:1-993(+)
MEAIKMHLTVLPPRLNIATILRPNIGVMAHPVLRQLFYTERNEDSFFCITKTEYELSLVLEDKYLKEVLKFADSNHLKDCIEYWPQNWIALRTDLGSSGADNGESVVNSLAKTLSAADITIFYLSTYSSDYCLVEEHNVEKALQVLRQEFKLIVEGEELITSSFDKLNRYPNDLEPMESPRAESKKRKLFFHDTDLQLACVSPESVASLSVFLMKCFFFTKSWSKIISFIQIEGEISLLGDYRYFEDLPEEQNALLSKYSESWKAFSIGEELGYSESGIVYSISSPLSACNTSIFYLSTFRTDFCLVIASDVENSVHTLKTHFSLENKRE